MEEEARACCKSRPSKIFMSLEIENEEIEMSKFKRGNKTPIQISSGHQVRSGADPEALPRDATLLAVIPGHPPTLTTDLEKQTWANICQVLIERELLTSTDLMILESYVVSYSLYIDARETLRHEGHLVKDDAGRLRPNPLRFVVTQELQHTIKLARELGLTPRTRLEINALLLKNKNLENALSSDHVVAELDIIGTF